MSNWLSDYLSRLVERSKQLIVFSPAKTPELLEVDMRTGKETPVSETDKGKLWLIIATNKCPDCHHEGFYDGPSGGLSTNITCANDDCKQRFNVTPMIGIAERI